MDKMIINLVLILGLVSSVMSTCQNPQTLYHIANNSIFSQNLNIPTALQQAFSGQFDDITYDTGSIFKKNAYSLKNIAVTFNYDSNTQVNSISTNQIEQVGGQLQFSISFNFSFASGGQKGSGSAIGQFPGPFTLNVTNTATFVAGKGLNWACAIQQLNFSSIIFLRQTGNDLTPDQIQIFNQLLTTSQKGQYVSLVDQLQTRMNKTSNSIAEINNQVVQSLFGNNKDYTFDGQHMSIDQKLVGYSLSSSGETLQVVGTPVDQNFCLDLELSPVPATYVGVSTSFINNTFNFLESQQYFDIDMNSKEWTVPNFNFQVQDFVFILPKITQYYAVTEKVGGPCTFDSGTAPALNYTSSTFFMNATYSCSLRVLSAGDLIMTFNVNEQLTLVPQFGNSSQINFVIQNAEFYGYNYKPVQKLAPIKNSNLLQYFLDNAGDTLFNTQVYGSGIFDVPLNNGPVTWGVSTQGDTLYFYGDINTSPSIQQS